MQNPYDPPQCTDRQTDDAAPQRTWPGRLTVALILFPVFLLLTMPVLQMRHSSSAHDRNVESVYGLIPVIPLAALILTLTVSSLLFRRSSHVARVVAVLLLLLNLSFAAWAYLDWQSGW